MIQWDESFAIGVRSIDQQHEELFKRANDFFGAVTNRKEPEHLSRLLDCLESYVVHHFVDEEAAMKKILYPERGEHVLEHRYFKQQFENYRSVYEFEFDGSSEALVGLYDLLANWFRDHILVVDQKLGAYLRKRQMLDITT